jgi:prefoldin subunit 5
LGLGAVVANGQKDRKAEGQEVYALLIADKKRSFDKPDGESDSDFNRYLHTQAVLLTDRLVLNHALNKLKDKVPAIKDRADSLTWLEKNLDVRILENTGILRVSLKGENAEDSVAIVKEVIDSYLQESKEDEAKQQKDRLDLLGDSSHRYRDVLQDQRKRLSLLAEVANTSDPSHMRIIRDQMKDELEAFRKEFRQIKWALISVKAKIDVKTQLAATNQKSVAEVSQLKEEQSVLGLQVKQLFSEIEALEKQAQSLPRILHKIDSSSSEIEATEQILKRIDTAKSELEIEMQFRPRIRILQQPMAATTKQN